MVVRRKLLCGQGHSPRFKVAGPRAVNAIMQLPSLKFQLLNKEHTLITVSTLQLLLLYIPDLLGSAEMCCRLIFHCTVGTSTDVSCLILCTSNGKNKCLDMLLHGRQVHNCVSRGGILWLYHILFMAI